MKNIDCVDAADAVIWNIHCKCIDNTVNMRTFAHVRCYEPGPDFLEEACAAAQFQFKALHREISIAQPCQGRIEREKSGTQQGFFPDNVLMCFEQPVIVKDGVPDTRVKQEVTKENHALFFFFKYGNMCRAPVCHQTFQVVGGDRQAQVQQFSHFQTRHYHAGRNGNDAGLPARVPGGSLG